MPCNLNISFKFIRLPLDEIQNLNVAALHNIWHSKQQPYTLLVPLYPFRIPPLNHL